MYKKNTLKNGLRIITVPQEKTLAATVLILVGTGSKYEKKELNGISHFLEHMFFKGTKKRPSPLSIAEELDKVGGVFNAFTGEDYTGYYAKVEKSKLDLALEWVSDIFLNSTLPKKEIEKERKVIIEEINMIYDHPMHYIQFLWPKLLYGDQPAGRNIAGTKENVLGINRKDLVNYRKSHYVSSNTIVCIAGNFKTKETIKKVEKYFSGIPFLESPRKEKVIENQLKPRSLVEFRKTDQAHLVLGTRGYSLSDPMRYNAEVLSVVLGGMMSSRMFVTLREKLGLCYYIKTESFSDPDTGFLATQAGVDKRNTEKAISAILKEYKKIREKRVGSLELKKAKENIKGKLALKMESSDSLASFYSSQELLEGEILTLKELFKKIEKVSSSDILEVSNNLFKSENLNLALMGPFKEKEKINEILKL
jgi:predicted Zn-dependent peptidase